MPAGLEQLGRRQRPARCGGALGFAQAAAPAVQRRLDGAGGRREQVGDLVERHVECLLQDDGSRFLR
jgi:hypothetical protein